MMSSATDNKRLNEVLPPSTEFCHDAEKSEHNPGIFREGWIVNERGMRLRTYTAAKTEPPRGCIVASHGINGHALFDVLTSATPGGRHTCLEGSVAELFLDSGLAFYCFDCEGHGLSESRGPRGYFENGWDLAADLALVARLVRRERPGLPVFCWGISMGGGVSLGAAMTDRSCLDGLVLAAPMVSVERVLSRFPNRLLSRLAPVLFRWLPIIRKLRVVSMPTGPPAAHKSYVEDPLTASARMYMAGPAFAALLFALDIAKKLEAVSTPFLTMHAREDPFTDFVSSEMLMARAEATDKTFEVAPPGSNHSLLTDPVSAEWTRQTVRKWLDEHCS